MSGSVECLNCQKEISKTPAFCAICKDATYCDKICGAEDWEDHVQECNHLLLEKDIDFLIIPEDFEGVGEEDQDFMITFPEGSVKVSDLGRKFGDLDRDQFFPSKEGVPAGGVDLDFENPNVGETYKLTITVSTLDGNTLDTISLQGTLKDDIKVRRFQSRANNEVVLVPDINQAVRMDGRKDPVEFDASVPRVINFFLEQETRGGNEILVKPVFNVTGVMLPNNFFDRKNKYGGLRTLQAFAQRKGRATREAAKQGKGGKTRRFFSAFFRSKAGKASSSYKGKMQSSTRDEMVKIAIILTKDDSSNLATLDEVVMKIHPKAFREGSWSNPTAQEGDVAAEGVNFSIDPIEPYDVTDVSSLLMALKAHADDVETEIVYCLEDPTDKVEVNFAQEFKRHLTKIKRTISTIEPHQKTLESNIGGEIDEADQDTLQALRDAVKLQEIGISLFKKRADRLQKAWYKKKMKDGYTLQEIMDEAQAYIRLIKPEAAESRWGKLKAAGKKLFRKFKGQRGKAKGRLRADMQILRDHLKRGDLEKFPGAGERFEPSEIQEVISAGAEVAR